MNLTTPYLGLSLRNPIIVGASPFCDDVDTARELEDDGAAAVVMRSIFQEQLDSRYRVTPKSTPDPDLMPGSFPAQADYQFSPDEYVNHLQNLKRRLTIPVIASINVDRPGEWTGFLKRLEAAGADAIELNFYRVVTDVGIGADEIELQMIRAVKDAADAVAIPISVKLSPFHSSVSQLALAFELAGARGVAVFNRFYQPDINTTELEVKPYLPLSDSSELLLRLRWLAILSPQLRGSLGVTGGVHTGNDIVKSILAGAHGVQVVSALLRGGPRHLVELLRGLRAWMNTHGYEDIGQFRGRLNHARCPNPGAYERANYIRTLQLWQN